jgi:predicted SPOUT superfamily RNA methylase MTH1
LVDILKSFAVEQTKIDQGLQMLLASQDKVDQVLQGQKKLDIVLQSQENVKNAIQGQGVGTIATQETILTTQKKITDALEDLRRKANVNISRTEDVLKKLKKQK